MKPNEMQCGNCNKTAEIVASVLARGEIVYISTCRRHYNHFEKVLRMYSEFEP